MKNPFDQIETRLQTLIESSLLLIPGNIAKPALAHQFSEAISCHLISEGESGAVAPGQFIMHVHPDTFAQWQEIENKLESILFETARDAGLTFNGPPMVQITADPALTHGEIEIRTVDNNIQIGDTAIIYLEGINLEQKIGNPDLIGAYLIIDGGELFLLDRPVINIGRKHENHLVIDDPRVSRNHCQLRLVNNHYVLFDLNSTGGTFINHIRISNQILTTGDVISLAGFHLIYGEDPDSISQTTGRITPNPDSPKPNEPGDFKIQ